MTHIRHAGLTTATYCGLPEAASTVSLPMLQAIQRGEVVPFAACVVVCEACETIVGRLQ